MLREIVEGILNGGDFYNQGDLSKYLGNNWDK